jgi:hypothetical protein
MLNSGTSSIAFLEEPVMENENKRSFIVVSKKTGDNLPYYATENGFEHFNPFHGKPFNELLLLFDDEETANEFVKTHCQGEKFTRAEQVTQAEQAHFESLKSRLSQSEKLNKFILAERERRRTLETDTRS